MRDRGGERVRGISTHRSGGEKKNLFLEIYRLVVTSKTRSRFSRLAVCFAVGRVDYGDSLLGNERVAAKIIFMERY